MTPTNSRRWLRGLAGGLTILALQAAVVPPVAQASAFEAQVLREVRAQLRRDLWKAAHPEDAACPLVPDVPPWPKTGLRVASFSTELSGRRFWSRSSPRYGEMRSSKKPRSYASARW